MPAKVEKQEMSLELKQLQKLLEPIQSILSVQGQLAACG
jgi:hypothetical protein